MRPTTDPKPSLLTTRHARLVVYIDIDEHKQLDLESTTDDVRGAIAEIDCVDDVKIALVSKDWR